MRVYSDLVNDFNNIIVEKLKYRLRKYQEHVAGEIIRLIRDKHRFIVVSMPTGSGKTLVEIFTTFYGIKHGFPRILVLEPTRFLCDQMYSGGKGGRGGLWKAVFGELVGKEYEGECNSFLDPSKKIILSTPQTALKCASMLGREFKMVIIDEVHHAFGGRYYTELLMELNPDIMIGFTALLPSYKKYRLDPKVQSIFGEPYILEYDFKKLEEIDPEFEPPKAVADMFDAEMNKHEDKAYEILFKALPEGRPRTIKFLECTLARYGKEAFCESYKRAVEKGNIVPYKDLDEVCELGEPSHKARILADILTVYNIKGDSRLRPVLIFTSRKATAYEFRRVIIDYIGFPGRKVAILTSDVKKEERAEIVKMVKNGEIDIIISTLVGEEGIDIPEAGLLIMMDVPKSPLRFYQRLGRLIRMSSPKRIKYLVVSLTPKTIEYHDLEDAMWNLSRENVDISYIIIDMHEKSLTAKVLDIIKGFTRINKDTPIPYILLTRQEIGDPLNYIYDKIKEREEYVALIKDTMRDWGFNIESNEDLEEAIYRVLTSLIYRWGAIKRIFKLIEKEVNRSRFSREFNKAVREGEVFYIYDIEYLSEIINHRLEELYKECEKGGKCYDEFFRIDIKSILRLFTRAFPYNNITHVISKLEAKAKEYEEYLNKMKESGVFQDYRIWIYWGEYNERAKSLSPQVIVRLELDNIHFGVDAQINYYDVSEELSEDSNIIKLIKTNLLAVGYGASKKFLDHYIEEYQRNI